MRAAVAPKEGDAEWTWLESQQKWEMWMSCLSNKSKVGVG